ncbi:MAG TPA: PEP/pyruvate-binding domain-containing protein [Chloroflexota bacterium]|nr:PEP/pyruvate-binding domain-containing protein [Chloroflexota bacterium]
MDSALSTLNSALVLWLSDPAAVDRARAGGKGASLAQLTRWRLPVPPGFVVPTDALAALLEQTGALAEARRQAATGALSDPAAAESAAADLQSRVRAAPMPPALRAAIAEAYRRLGTPTPPDRPSTINHQPSTRVAVRSSATAEDSATASFAGQQDTYLDVEGEGQVLERVQACAASLFTPRALVYRARRDAWADLGLAVVVQAMVDARAAGIMFTRDPVQRRDRVVVEAVPGSGEALASGEAVPDHYELDRPTGTLVSQFVQPRPSPVLTPDELQELLALGRRIEQLFGAPQDLEWAFGDRLYLLQSRPITTL